jgi:citrate lyase subunit alpha/citrate CoA-transferase
MEWTNNALGRKIPVEIEGKTCAPFLGAFIDSRKGGPKALSPERTSRTAPVRQKPDKLVADWEDLFDRLDLRDGASISFHHHLRNGDNIVNEVVAPSPGAACAI